MDSEIILLRAIEREARVLVERLPDTFLSDSLIETAKRLERRLQDLDVVRSRK